MNKIDKLEHLIKECESIRDGVSAEKTLVNKHGIPLFFVRLDDNSKFYTWRISLARFITELGDFTTLNHLMRVIDNIETVLADQFVTEDPNLQSWFNYIILELDALKKICLDEYSNKVFVVHGHSELLIAQTESFLQRLGFEPIILRNQANQGQTIIEKLESNTNVPFAIVLYTSCDQGRLNDNSEPLKPRARQNVVFEHGYLNAKLGRNRVCALVEDGVEYPGDLSGVVYIPIDPNGAWKIKVANEMKAAGLNVDKNKL